MLSSLVSEWTFDEGSNQAVNRTATNDDVKDTWGTNHGTVVGSPQIKGGDDCVYGRCMSFDGANDYVALGSNSLAVVDDIAISAWVKPNYLVTTGDQGGIIIGGSSLNHHRFFITNNKIHYYIYDGTTTWLKARNYNFELNKWYHVAVTADKFEEKAYWYVNGKQIGLPENKTVWPTTIDSKLQFIGAVSGAKGLFDGSIDDLRVYNSALSSSQIKQNYIAGLDSMLSKGTLLKDEYNERIQALANPN
ncbi:MAG: LamG domain-containing protein [Candidatus Paceibacterota bacterium]